ncbi:MAG: methyl-accepting chemotaxis protein [Candidatus Omnitrophica bacterium]|nr:methyl-accepting chemotaxis protein [Candidatus Omnitrophota bacterium]
MKYRRRHLAHFGIQFKYLLFIALGMVVPLLVVSGAILMVFWEAAAAEMVVPEGIAQVLKPALARAGLTLFFLLPLVCILILWASLLVSNRIAGPILRLERELIRMAEGKEYHALRVRKHDELESLVSAINRVLGRDIKN